MVMATTIVRASAVAIAIAMVLAMVIAMALALVMALNRNLVKSATAIGGTEV